MTLEEVVERRAAAAGANATREREQQENGLSRSLRRLLLLVEDYPELQADEGYRRLHGDLVEVEEHIQYARRYFNGAVRDFNNRIQQFPANLLAPLFGMRAGEFFEVDAVAERRVPAIESRV